MMWLLAVIGYIAGMIGMRYLVRLIVKEALERRKHRETALWAVCLWPMALPAIAVFYAFALLDAWITD